MTAPARRLPLRTQVLLLLLGTVALVVLLASVGGAVALRSYLLDRVDDTLATSVQATRQPLDRGGGDARPDRRRGAPDLPPPREFVTAVYAVDGTVATLAGLAVGTDAAPALPALGALPRGPFTVPTRSGPGQWRALARPLADGRTVVVALPLSDVDDTVGRLLLINGGVGLLALLGAGLLGAVGVRRSLRPLVEVEETAEAIAAGDLTRRVPSADPRTEVGSLAASFNAMVGRFESAWTAQQASESAARASEQRMRRFVADAGHELRTPLTTVRGFAELYRQGAVPPAELPRVMGRIEAEGTRMGTLVDDLLLLARLDQQRPLKRAPVDLGRLAADVVHDVAAVRPEHRVGLLPVQGEVVVDGDDARLRQVLTNLVTNATTHTPAGTAVRVSVQRAGDVVVVQVRDDGPGMPAAVAERVFERFYRADDARTRVRGSSGLGLSIVAALVHAHGGQVAVDSRPGAGSTFTVRLPVEVPGPGTTQPVGGGRPAG